MNASATVPAAEIAVRTDPGRDPDKQVNEDSSTTKETSHGLLAVVCDGMGGHAGGKEASELAIQTIVEIVEAAPAATRPGDALKRAIEEANLRVWSMPTAEPGFRPGSTVVAMIAHEGGSELAHVGDSRIYLVHAGAISQVTRDHSMVQEMVDRNLIRAEDAAKHPDANKILRALGIAKEVEVELRPEPILHVAGDTFVLCSDGLSDLVEPAEILEIAGGHPVQQAAAMLVDLANARGGHDNITAVVVRMKTSATPRTSDGRFTGPKTIPLTAHDPMPGAEAGHGRTGTILSPAGGNPAVPGAIGGANVSAPPAHAGGTALQAPMGPPGSGPSPYAHPHPGLHPTGGVAIPPAPPSNHSPSSVGNRRPNPAMVVLGILLAIVAVGVLAALVFVAIKPKRRTVVPLVEVHRDASVTPDDEAGAEPVATTLIPAPPLSADTTWKKLDGGPSDPCAALRRAKARDASADAIDKLTQKCLAAGGAP